MCIEIGNYSQGWEELILSTHLPPALSRQEDEQGLVCAYLLPLVSPRFLALTASVYSVLFLAADSGLCSHIPLSLVNAVSTEEMTPF